MSSLTDGYENSVLNNIWGNVPLTPPATWYVGLMIGSPNDDGSGVVEPTGGGNNYSRVAIANNLTEWPSAVGGLKANANAIVFPIATVAWGAVTHYGFFDAPVGGGFLRSFSILDSPRTISAGDSFQFLAGDCKISAD